MRTHPSDLHPSTGSAAAPLPAPLDPQTAPVALSRPPRRWSSSSLFGLEREVEIEHAGQVYRLRQTSLGKLILTK